MAMASSVFLQIPLVILLGAPKGRRGHNLGDDRLLETAALLELLLERLRRGLLFRRMIEHHRAVLGSVIRPLPVRSRRIVVLPEHLQKLLVSNLGGIVFHLHDFGMSRLVGAHVFISRVGERASHVADGGGTHSGDPAKGFFDAPETAGSESGLLRHGYGLLQQGRVRSCVVSEYISYCRGVTAEDAEERGGKKRDPVSASIYPEGVSFHSPGSRSAPWEKEAKGSILTPKGLSSSAQGALRDPGLW